MSIPRVLFVTDHYIDKKIGGANASRGFIRAFSEFFDKVAFIYPDYVGSDIEKYIPSNVTRIPCIDERSKIKKGIDVYRGILHRYGAFLKDHFSSNQYELIIIDHSRIWSSLTDTFLKSGAKIITIHHNVEKKYVRDNPDAFYLRIPRQHYAIKAEKEAVINSDINLTLTGKDTYDLLNLYPEAKGNFYHLGAFDFDVNTYIPGSEDNSNTFIITGALSYRQSSVPITEFINMYWPIVLKEKPLAKLIIAGREPTKQITRICASFPSIDLVANPPEMSDYLKKAAYYICPINLGSGQKTRISDGLKNGIPVLCHEASVYGYETVKEAGFMFSYHDEESFSSSLKKMLEKHINGQEVFNSYYDFFSLEAGIKRLRGILERENVI